MLKGLKSIFRIAAGLILFMLGVIGLFIPILQGVLLIFIAIPIISPEHGRKMVGWMKKKWKKRKNDQFTNSQ